MALLTIIVLTHLCLPSLAEVLGLIYNAAVPHYAQFLSVFTILRAAHGGKGCFFLMDREERIPIVNFLGHIQVASRKKHGKVGEKIVLKNPFHGLRDYFIVKVPRL